MKISLRSRVSISVALVIIIVSGIGTFLFIASSSRSMEKKLVARGAALSDALSKAAEEGLAAENLDLIRKASYIVQRKDVVLVQVYSSMWEAIDAYPFERIKDPADPDAVSHFRRSDRSFYSKAGRGYDFYNPILFKPSEDSPALSIGFVRLVLSPSDMEREVAGIVVGIIIASGIVTLLAIATINTLVGRLVVKPVMKLHSSVSQFKRGELPHAVAVSSRDEIGELSEEFNKMSAAIKEKTERLVASEKRIKSLFERVEHALFRLDSHGNIIEANARFAEMFGAPKTLCAVLLNGRHDADCLIEAAAEKVVQAEEKVLGVWGDELTVLFSLYPERDGNGEVAGYDGYLIDVTEKKRLEERLLRAQKLEAVGTLAGGIAHDFNNLLAAILGYSEILLDAAEENKEVHKPASIIHSAAERGAELTRKILAVTRKEKVENRNVNINEIVKSSIELLQRSIPKDIEIITDLREEIHTVRADPSQIQQVILNLAVNARDAMPEGGRLTIETDAVGTDGDAIVDGTPAKGGFIRLSVSDTGVGMSKETQSKVFDPFFTTKETGKGTGLGLYIVHSIVNNHGGYINLYSEPLKGTRFAVYLPVAKGEDFERVFETENLRGSETILVIDDEASVREICKDLLAPMGYEVLVAEDGNEGIALLRNRKDEISLVILDIIMPKMGGREVFQALRTVKPEVAVLLCSGYSQNGFAGIDHLLKGGAKGFVQKPFSRQAITLAIRQALSA